MRAWTECVTTADRSRRNARPRRARLSVRWAAAPRRRRAVLSALPCTESSPSLELAEYASPRERDGHRACLSRHEVARTFAACDACREPREHVEHTDDEIRFAHLDGSQKEKDGSFPSSASASSVYSGFGWLERGPHVSVHARAELVLLLVLNLFRCSAGCNSERVALNRVENLHLKVLISETFYVLSKDVLRNCASVRKSVHSLDARSFRSVVGGRFLLTKDMKAESLVIATPKFGAWGTRTWRSSAEERGILCAQQNRMRTLEFGARTEGIRDVLLREDGMAKIGIPTEEKHISSRVMGSRWGTLFKSTPSSLAKLPFISQLRAGFLHSVPHGKIQQ
ncbi:hypothetical protein DFH11DRAFT_1768787 [Phellopilus nigrolimitatus]|nr:hypothetical protein DFH11DRAFT_1768787 [Phellopilus nigrolimitatus]